MVATPLHVQRHQVHPETLVLWLEEMVGDLFSEDVVELLPRLGGQAHQKLVQLARNVDQLRVEESVGQWQHLGGFPLVV